MTRYTFDAIATKSAYLQRGEVRAGQGVHVLIGWDTPLQGFFMSVRAAEAEGQGGGTEDTSPDSGVVFTSLALPESYPDSLDAYLDVLHAIGVVLPGDIAGRLICDQTNSQIARKARA